jgi:hypothetical protein
MQKCGHGQGVVESFVHYVAEIAMYRRTIFAG